MCRDLAPIFVLNILHFAILSPYECQKISKFKLKTKKKRNTVQLFPVKLTLTHKVMSIKPMVWCVDLYFQPVCLYVSVRVSLYVSICRPPQTQCPESQ